MTDRLHNTFRSKDSILNIYFTAGYPKLNDTLKIAKQLYENGVDMIEIGMPFSDPLADGLTIQNSSQVALKNGITIDLIFQQVSEIRSEISEIPIILMGYLNQLIQIGVEQFLRQAKQAGVDALIIPDLPSEIYQSTYKSMFESYGIKICFLITPQTPLSRVKEISGVCSGFLYMVSTFSTTGNRLNLNNELIQYFESIRNLNIDVPRLIGFGIHNKSSYKLASEYANGAIIGSAFIQSLKADSTLNDNITDFIKSIR